MRSLEINFGAGAGRIWSTLEGKEFLEEKRILETAKLEESDFYAGVGWLARENKIFREGRDVYKLGETNLMSEIGDIAGRVWRIMDIWGEVNVPTIGRLADLNENEVYAALGWLAREDKISVNEKQMYDLK